MNEVRNRARREGRLRIKGKGGRKNEEALGMKSGNRAERGIERKERKRIWQRDRRNGRGQEAMERRNEENSERMREGGREEENESK